jgi:hypothetical protein
MILGRQAGPHVVNIFDGSIKTNIASPPQPRWHESERAGGPDMLPEREKYTPQGMPKVNC